LIGREEEIALLRRRWEQAKAGGGSVVLIAGDPGIGKSRIAQALLEQVANEPQTRLRFFCSPHHQHTPFYPSITQLQQAAGFKREDTPETRLAKLVAVLSLANKDLSETVPLLADLLSIPTGDSYPPLNFTPQKRKEKTLQVQLAQAEGLAARQPLLILWEDIHWSDPTSLESLHLLIERAVNAAGIDDSHLSTGVHAALGRQSARDLAQSQPLGAPAERRDDHPRERWQGLTQGNFPANRRSH